MKIGSIEAAQHVSGIAILVFCLPSFFVNYDAFEIFFGINLCFISLFFVYLPNLLDSTYSKDEHELRNAKKVCILASWFWATWGLSQSPRYEILKSLSVVFFISSLVLGLFYYAKYRKEHLPYRKEETTDILMIQNKRKRFLLIMSLFFAVILIAPVILIQKYWNIWLLLDVWPLWYVWMILIWLGVFLTVFAARKYRTT